MAIVNMQKALLLAYKNDFEQIINSLQKFGQFEVADINEEKLEETVFIPSEEKTSEDELKLAQLDFLIRILTPYENKKKNFREKLLGAQIEGNEEDIKKVVSNFDYRPLFRRGEKIEEDLNLAKANIIKIEETRRTLAMWESLKFSPRFDRDTDNTEMRLGEIGTKDFADFLIRLSRIDYTHAESIEETTNNTYFLVLFHKDSAKEVEELLESFRFDEMDFSQCERTPKEELKRLADEEVEAKSTIFNLEKELKEMAKELDKLKLTYDYYLWGKNKHKAKLMTASSEKVVMLEGWVPEDKVDELKNELSKTSKNVDLISIESEENEQVPVEIKNNKAIGAFESVTRIFGLPQKDEIDPTPYLAPFFAVFFGFCLTDAGYGVLLIIASFLALKTLPLAEGMRKMIRLMFICGFTTFIMGVAFGGWFGLTVEQAPSFLVKDGKFIGQLFNPINDLTDKIMPLAYGMGFFQLLFGVILSGVIKLKNNKVFEAITTSFLLAVLILLTAGLVAGSTMGASESIVAIMKWSALALLLIVIWGLGTGNKNPIVRILIGILGLVDEAMSWLSNVLSYSRLFALGLATGIIATVFNSVALTIGGMLPSYLSIFVIVFIILFGHLINIGLNLLGAFIHSGRLQFVEFFGKFLECGGRRFEPLRRETKYLFSEKN